MTEEQKLLKLADKMILLCLNSEIITHRTIGRAVVIKEIARMAENYVNTPIDRYYEDIIEELRDCEIENLTLEGEEFSPSLLTSDTEWADMITDLVSQIKEQYLINA